MNTDTHITVTSTKNNKNRNRQILPLLFGNCAVTSAILCAGTEIYTSDQLMLIKSRMAKINGHLASLTETITKQHDKLVTIIIATDSLNEYTHK